MDKKTARVRRTKKPRLRMRAQGVHRLCVHRTPRHIYVQLIEPAGGRVLASASTLESDVKSDVGYGGNVSAATKVGALIAQRSIAAGVEQVAFDRSGFKYHGRVKALAEAAREGGLKF